MLETNTSNAQAKTEVPFSFTCGGEPAATFLKSARLTISCRGLDSTRTAHLLRWTDSRTGLEVVCEMVDYRDFPTVEWTLYFKNSGSNDSPVIADILALDTLFGAAHRAPFLLHHNQGTTAGPTDFEPLVTRLGPSGRVRFAPPDGRPCTQVWPYFNLEGGHEGVIIAVGWPGQWAAEFSCLPDGSCRVAAGQELTRFRLHPGEQVRSPLMVVQHWKGNWLRAQNLWRRWMLLHNVPRVGGDLPHPLFLASSAHVFDNMVQATEANQKRFMQRYLEEHLRPDYWWMDAGWYPNTGTWENTGTWLVDSNRFPSGLRAVTDFGHAHGLKSLLWFEPERVTPGTWLERNHPEWLLGGQLLDLANTNAWNWLVDHLDTTLVQQGIDLYRWDFNCGPLSFWRTNDTPERQGITENHYCTAYLAVWDELHRRHPEILMDACASGGRRLDLETLRRALSFTRSDAVDSALANQGHSFGLALWVPYHGTLTYATGAYELRSAMSCPLFTANWEMQNPKLPSALLRRLVTQWRGFAENYLGDFYPLTPYSLAGYNWLAWQFDQPEKGTGLVQVFRHANNLFQTARFKLQGLDTNAVYQVTDLDAPGAPRNFGGAELMSKGLLVSITNAPGAAVLTYRVAGRG